MSGGRKNKRPTGMRRGTALCLLISHRVGQARGLGSAWIAATVVFVRNPFSSLRHTDYQLFQHVDCTRRRERKLAMLVGRVAQNERDYLDVADSANVLAVVRGRDSSHIP
jgi:hypothetical protein